MKVIVIFIFLLVSANVYANSITGTGCAGNRDRALEYALADVSLQISARVESDQHISRLHTSDRLYEYISNKIRVTSDLPIMGHTTQDVRDCVTVTLTAERALPLYIKEAEKLRTNINALTKPSESPDSITLKSLSAALDSYAQWHKLALVVTFLDGRLTPPDVDMGEIERKVITIKRVSADIPQIAENILQGVNTRNLYVNSVKLQGSLASPPFASLLTAHLRQKTRNAPEGSRQKMDCQYSPEGDPFIIACEIKDVGINKPVRQILTSVSQKICEQIECYVSARTAQLEKSFHSMGDMGLRGHFYTNWGTDGVVLSEGDVVSVFARVNTPAELALISMPVNGNAKVIPLSSENIKKISQNDTNRQVELIKLKVTPPFGDEALILIGYGGDLAPMLTQESFTIADLNKLRQKITDKPHFEKKIMFHTNAGINE